MTRMSSKPTAVRRGLVYAAFLTACVVIAAGPAFAQTNSDWVFTNGSGNWSDPANWTNGVPNGNYNATIYTSGLAAVTLDINATVANLSLGPGLQGDDALFVDSGKTLTVTNTLQAESSLSLSNDILNVQGDFQLSECNSCGSSFSAGGGQINVGGTLTTSQLLYGAQFYGVSVTVNGDYVNDNSPVQIQQGTVFTVNGNFSNSGAMTLSITGASTVTVNGTITDSAVWFNGPGLLVDSSSTLTTHSGYSQTASSYAEIDGTLNAGGSGVVLQGPSNGNFPTTLILNGTINGKVDVEGGYLSGSGKINGNVAMGGVIAPDPLTINGNYEQTAGGIFDESISGTGNSLLVINGNALLDPGASLDILLAGGFDPVGDSFTIMDYESLSGEFANGTSFNADGYHWDLSYGPDDAVLTAVGPAGAAGTPEPGTLFLLCFGIIGLIWAGRARLDACLRRPHGYQV